MKGFNVEINLDRMKQLLRENRDNLIDEANEAINDDDSYERERRLEEEKDRQEQYNALRRAKSEEIADSIIKLVFTTLKNATTSSGLIDDLDEIFGTLSSVGEGARYKINENEIIISLDYSRSVDKLGAKEDDANCFLGEYDVDYHYDPFYKYDFDIKSHKEYALRKEKFDYDYLREILSPYGVSIERKYANPYIYIMNRDKINRGLKISDIVYIKASKIKNKESHL